MGSGVRGPGAPAERPGGRGARARHSPLQPQQGPRPGWLAGLEPVRLEISGLQLVLEAGMEDRWLLTNLDQAEAEAAARAFAAARTQAGGLQFMAVQANEADQRFEGFWLLRDLPDA